MKKYDVIILGAGTAGLAAYRAAKKTAQSVVIVDGGPLGTTCARVGCMPSKLLIAAAEAVHSAEHSKIFGVHTQVEVDGEAVMQRVRNERDRFVGFVLESIDGIDPKDRINAYGEFINDTKLRLSNGQIIEGNAIVVAVGSRPVHPPILNGAGSRLVTNDDIFEWPKLPKKVAVVGPGVIGLELGQALSRLGVEVKMFGASGSLGPLQDPTLRAYAIKTFQQEFYLDVAAKIIAVTEQEHGVGVTYIKDGVEVTEVFEYVVAATGRRPNLDKLGLENTQLALNAHGIPPINHHTLQADQSPIFIAGDANNDRPLLHEAADEGKIAGSNAAQYPQGIRAGKRRTPIAVVFSDPQMATVGLSFPEVQKRCEGCFALGEVSFENQGRSRVMNVNTGLLHVYAEQGTGLLLGAEMFGPRAEHMAHLLSWVIQQRLTVSQILELPFYHPVIEEGVRTALRDVSAKLKIGPEVLANCMECGPGG